MLRKLLAKSLGQVLRSTRRSYKMPDPYRESYRPGFDPIVISGFLLVTVPIVWMAYDIAFETDKDIQPK
ncbi:hypothetical protein ECG_07304 [Echinococcus granulosus]|uniref:Uncharacterized protein n=1 Tax=Echinococcus granulosus TaxID=6210 RepID=U6JD11_ECHGR|nr:hypothetical protein EGR_07591 [Echinococcus granulosus]EUB57580.1 hypothetical protein EGR_07591 [Echinococcus granulosus]KAH9281193.1 hypothetical protein ECG_07304 [Echinococcus granulosus]CDS21976.1 hypothetical protein EgrG_000069310 [Echinococcus granulosus]